MSSMKSFLMTSGLWFKLVNECSYAPFLFFDYNVLHAHTQHLVALNLGYPVAILIFSF